MGKLLPRGAVALRLDEAEPPCGANHAADHGSTDEGCKLLALAEGRRNREANDAESVELKGIEPSASRVRF